METGEGKNKSRSLRDDKQRNQWLYSGRQFALGFEGAEAREDVGAGGGAFEGFAGGAVAFGNLGEEELDGALVAGEGERGEERGAEVAVASLGVGGDEGLGSGFGAEVGDGEGGFGAGFVRG